MAAAVPALWFDGRTSGARAVDLHLAERPGRTSVELLERGSGAVLLAIEPGAIRWPEAWSAAPQRPGVMLDLGTHGSLQVADAGAIDDLRARARVAAPLAQRMQTRWTSLLAGLAVAACVLVATYRWGTPWLAAQLTPNVPLAWELSVSERGLQELDRSQLRPSTLPAQRQAALRQRFEALLAAMPPSATTYRPQWRLAFRAGLGANALALPGGQVVVTDGLVETAQKAGLSDDAIAGVLAHEMGHVMRRHTTRLVVEQAVLNIGFGLALGDLSSVTSTAAALLTGLHYQRGHEAEADCFALDLMRRAGLPTAPTAELLLKIDRRGGTDAGWAVLLSSHPNTPERAAALRAGTDASCTR